MSRNRSESARKIEEPSPIMTANPAHEDDNNNRLLIALCFGIFAVQLDARVIAPILPEIGSELNISLSQSSWLMTAYLIPYGFFQIVFGPLAARFGKLPVIVSAMVVFSTATLLGSVWPSLEVMVLLRFIAGAGAAAMVPLSFTYVGDTYTYEKRQGALGRLLAASGIAAALSVGLGGIVASIVSWRWLFPFLGVLGLISTALLATRAKSEAKTEPIPILVSVRTYREVLMGPRMPTLLALAAIEGAINFGSFSFWSHPLVHKYGMSSFETGFILCACGVSFMISGRALQKVRARFSEAQVLLIGGLALSGTFLSLATIERWEVYVLASALLGLGYMFTHTTLLAKVSEVFPRNRALAQALFTFCTFVGSGIGSGMFSVLIDRIGFRETMGVIFLLAVWFFIWAYRYVGAVICKATP